MKTSEYCSKLSVIYIVKFVLCTVVSIKNGQIMKDTQYVKDLTSIYKVDRSTMQYAVMVNTFI